MFHFVQITPGIKDLFQQFAATIHIKPKGNRIDLPPAFGSGCLQFEQMPNGLNVLLLDYMLHEDMFYERRAGSKEFYTLSTREADVAGSFVTAIDKEEAREPAGKHKSLFLTSSLFDLSNFVSRGTHVEAVQIELTRDWMAQYLKMEVYDDILKEYLSLKIKALDRVIMDADYGNALHDILTLNREHPAEITILHNRVMYIIERFFTELYDSRRQLKYRIRNSESDIDNIISVEAAIISNITARFPSLHQLAKNAGMSVSKLKALFRKIYNKPIYQYYQEQRMIRAKAMLLSGNASVKTAALEMGFKTASNFSIAFKKQFEVLPSEFTKRGK